MLIKVNTPKVVMCLSWLFIPLIGFLIYWQALGYGYVPYDDPAYVSENKFVTSGFTNDSIQWAFFYNSELGELKYVGAENLWHPLTWLSHMLDVELFGADFPQGHHCTNILLFILTSWLVMLVSNNLTGNKWAGFWVALLWMLHPLKVESVSWISERKDLLSGFFFWASLWAVLLSETSKKSWYWIGYGLFFLALLSKPSVVVLPVLLLFVNGYLKGEKRWGMDFFIKNIKQLPLWFFTAGIFSLVTLFLQFRGSHEVFIQQSSFVERFLTIAAGFWFYIFRILYPVNLNFEYPTPNIPLWAHLLAWSCLISTLWFMWRKRKSHRLLFLGCCWFIVCWFPASGVIYVGSSFTADRYMYLAIAGLFLPFAAWISSYPWKTVIPLLLCSSWAFLSWKQVTVWKDGRSLFSHSTRVSPDLPAGWVNLGSIYQNEDQFEEAISCYEKAISLNALDYVAWYNLGRVQQNAHNLQAAEVAYRKSTEVYSDYLPSTLNLGIILRSQGKLTEALSLFMKGADKDLRMLWLACDCELQLKNYSKADELLRQLEKLNPDTPLLIEKMMRARSYLNSVL